MLARLEASLITRNGGSIHHTAMAALIGVGPAVPARLAEVVISADMPP